MNNLFVLVALLCTNNGQCDHYALDSNLSAYDCDMYFTDNGLTRVDELIYVVVNEEKQPLTLQSLECIQEDTE